MYKRALTVKQMSIRKFTGAWWERDREKNPAVEICRVAGCESRSNNLDVPSGDGSYWALRKPWRHLIRHLSASPQTFSQAPAGDHPPPCTPPPPHTLTPPRLPLHPHCLRCTRPPNLKDVETNTFQQTVTPSTPSDRLPDGAPPPFLCGDRCGAWIISWKKC